MFVALREIRFAKGRFAIITSVIGLLTFLVVALSALTTGLGDQSVSAVDRLPGHTLVVQSATDGERPSLDRSALPPAAVARLTAGNGARLGVTTTRITAGRSTQAVALFGADAALPPTATSGRLPGDDGIMVNADMADELGVRVGDPVTVGDRTLRIDGIGATGSFAHTPVGYTTIDTWHELSHGQDISAVVLDAAAPRVDGTTAVPMSKVRDTVPGYASEHGSLLAMQALLLAISGLVVGSFFAVWTAQRLHSQGIVRALGGSRGYLLRDGLGQALIVLVFGETVGAALGAGLAVAISGVVPVSLTVGAVMVPAVGMAVLGMVGALLAVRKVTVVDPLVALSH